ncbi:MAG: DNA-3-methyladenine glycosylase [Oscillospiraceae bacterium]|nr:DNA-3-methyladenine glycosylase [Oscillospiraceae bacterium]
MRIDRSFFERDAVAAARELIGHYLVRVSPEGITKARIVETESYMGEIDDAAHSYKGKTERVRALYGEKGRAYIYLIYGMYNCLNISAGPEGVPQCILIRAAEPVDGIPLMESRRKTEKRKNLCSGPGKLCMAMDITRELYDEDMVEGDVLYIEAGESLETQASKRIGIDYAENCRDKLWRFTAKGNIFVSKP